MIGAPDWRTDGRDWPNRAHSRFVVAGGLRWHVQEMGRPSDPTLLLLHGTGAATHSWRDLMPKLAERFHVVAPDLPGHGFTALPPARGASCAGMARLVSQLVTVLGVVPQAVVGHSAGAAIAARMAIDGTVVPRVIVSLNGALLPPAGPASVVFPVAAKLLATNPLVPWLFSLNTSAKGTDKLLASTGSRIDAAGARFYARLIGRPGHVAGALRMMSHWDIGALELRRLTVPLVLVAGEKDGMVPPAAAREVAALLPRARLVLLPGLGHLAHEEAPDLVAGLIADAVMPQPVLEECA